MQKILVRDWSDLNLGETETLFGERMDGWAGPVCSGYNSPPNLRTYNYFVVTSRNTYKMLGGTFSKNLPHYLLKEKTHMDWCRVVGRGLVQGSK